MEDSNLLRPEFSRLMQTLSNLDRSNTCSNAERVQIKEALSAALSRLETPWETAVRIAFTQVGLTRAPTKTVLICKLSKSQPALAATLKVCFDISLFQRWVQEYRGGQANGEDLAKLVGVEPSLLRRLH